MSRIAETQAHGFEFYPTERDVVHALLESSLISLQGGLWLEPCAGTGRILSAVRSQREDISWVVHEIDDRFDQYLRPELKPDDVLAPFGDFCSIVWPPEGTLFDVAIFNPPFSLTMEFVQAAMKISKTVVCLQRQGWFGTQARAPWLREHCPDTYDLPWRPSFRPDGKTDSCEYSFFVWPEGQHNRRSGTRAMLDRPKSKQLKLFGQ